MATTNGAVAGPGAVVKVQHADGEIEALRLTENGQVGQGVITPKAALYKALYGAREGDQLTYEVDGERITATLLQVLVEGHLVPPVSPSDQVRQKVRSPENEVPEVPLEFLIGPVTLRQYLALSPGAWKLYGYLNYLAKLRGSAALRLPHKALRLEKGLENDKTVEGALAELKAHELIVYSPSPTGTTITLLPPPKHTPLQVVKAYTDKLDKQIDQLTERLKETEETRERWNRLGAPAVPLAGDGEKVGQIPIQLASRIDEPTNPPSSLVPLTVIPGHKLQGQSVVGDDTEKS